MGAGVVERGKAEKENENFLSSGLFPNGHQPGLGKVEARCLELISRQLD